MVEDTAVKEKRTSQKDDDEFTRARQAKAAEQGLSGDEAVPEKRPIASQLPNPSNEVSDLTKRLQDDGEINTKAMGKEAYDRAASDDQKDKAEESSLREALKPGDVAKVTKGPHRGRTIALTRVVSYRNTKDLAIQNSGRPEANFVQPAEVEGRARGDERDGEVLILNVDEAGLEKVANWLGTGRG